jgi:pimeloyl-ACP methyl ester carboxylesterase
MSKKSATVVLAHGAWADPSSWGKVVNLLQSKGIKAVTFRLPLSSLADDVAALDGVLAQVDGPVVLVGHAYAGAVIAATQSPKVQALVYVAGLAPDEGETVAEVFNRYEHDDKAPKLAPGNDGLIRLPLEAFSTAFAQNAAPDEQQALAAAQPPISPACITVPVARPRWRDVPTWYLLAEHDHMIPAQTQRFMAERMKAHIEAYPVDHLPSVTAPELVETLIVEAVRQTEDGSRSRLRAVQSQITFHSTEIVTMSAIHYRHANVDGLNIFYREAGSAGKPKLLLLHGYPSAGHMFRDLIPLLSDSFHIIAPDLPGFGQSDMPPRDQFTYTFDNIANVIDRFTEVVGFDRFAVYVFDYGAPTGFRIAVKHPERITAIISQNGNAYEEGLSDGWNPIRAYWENPSAANREALRAFLAPETTRWQYTHGVADESLISPDGIGLDNYYLARKGADDIQLDLFLNYQSNVALYPTFQAYFRRHRPRFLAVWGKNDPFFLPPGAEAFKRDIPEAQVQFFDTGHFALETHAKEIAQAIRDFLTA